MCLCLISLSLSKAHFISLFHILTCFISFTYMFFLYNSISVPAVETRFSYCDAPVCSSMQRKQTYEMFPFNIFPRPDAPLLISSAETRPHARTQGRHPSFPAAGHRPRSRQSPKERPPGRANVNKFPHRCPVSVLIASSGPAGPIRGQSRTPTS